MSIAVPPAKSANPEQTRPDVSLFETHNYRHEPLTSAFVDEVIATGNPAAIKMALYAITLEGVLHQIADHPETHGDNLNTIKRMADEAIHGKD